MNKIIIATLAIVGLFAFATPTFASTQCGNPSDSTVDTTFVACGNGMPAVEPVNWVHYNPGESTCPAWFSWGWRLGCFGPKQ